jgi:ribosomal protein L23
MLLRRMNKPEIKNYLEAIYDVEVAAVRTQIVQGEDCAWAAPPACQRQQHGEPAFVALV